MLTTEAYTLDEAIDELADQIDALEAALTELDSGTDEYTYTQGRRNRLRYYKDGLEWQRDEEGWSPDAEIELGAMTAAEEALMHREMPSNVEKKERRNWFVAASTAAAPYHSDDLSETFTDVGQCHPAFVDWAEAKANALGVPGVSGNRSEGESGSTNSSSSPSPME
ncbi:hypothetical protein C482_15356 [Natrialba chahannaoensis JCM 10990]|uniref:Uncharacterized protein n=1 Tax=Natrialba chahannaoensis JCM 10990 TaxID=1227492 RepID=M0ADZ1_9EURY|nr:hypothetical protein [Natrialba chahannaoensis]ELY96764.1 hypothetical protein C482_15356 [Natrialba chahannaoensis JCM 10990]